jgi:predicted DCC family thiol-disulfide oxidoreductase YuxK
MTKITVWYDASCPLCRREISLMNRLDRNCRINFVDASDSAASCPIDRADMLARLHVSHDGKLLCGAAAFGAMWRAIPVLRPAGLAMQLPAVERLFEWLYLRFLQIRPKLQRLLS